MPLKRAQFIFSKNIHNNYVKPRTKTSRIQVNHDHETFDYVREREREREKEEIARQRVVMKLSMSIITY